MLELRPLLLAGARDRLPGVQPGLRGEAGAVVGVRAGAAPQVRLADLGEREGDGAATGQRGGALALAEGPGGEEGELGLVGLGLLQLFEFGALRAGERGDQLLDRGEVGRDLGLGGVLLDDQRLGGLEGLLGLLLQAVERLPVGLQLVQELGLRAAGRGQQFGDGDGLVRVLGEQEFGVGGGGAVAVLGGGELGGDVRPGVDLLLLPVEPALEVGERGLLFGDLGHGAVVLLGGGLGALVEPVQLVEQRAEGGLGRGERVGAGGGGDAGARVGCGVGGLGGDRQRERGGRKDCSAPQGRPHPGAYS